MIFEILLILILFIFTLLTVLENIRNGDHLPPGPLKIPIFGNLIQLPFASTTPYLALHKLSLKYGDVMSIKFGVLEAVVLSSYDSIKDVFNMDDSNFRYCEGILRERCLSQNLGLILANGESWQTMRKFTAKGLRDYGFGRRSSMEKIVEEELQHFMLYMRRIIDENEGTIHFDIFFHATFVNLMWSLVAGKRYEYDDEKVIHLLNASKKFIKAGAKGIGLLTAFVPSLRYFFPQLTGYNYQKEANRDLHQYFKEVLEEYRANLDTKMAPECFIDVFLQEMAMHADDEDSHFTDDQFVLVLLDLFQAGSETTGSTLSFAILFLSVQPEIQRKIKREIENVIGFERKPLLADRDKMVYTQAFMLETFRWGRIVVNFVPRIANKDIYYKAFTIKKGTVIMGNQHSVNFDNDFWGDPCVFRPERFLSPSGHIEKLKADRIIPFGVGKRICLGESLARDSFFLYLTTLVQNFTFKPIPGHKVPSLEPSLGFTMSPVPFDALVNYSATLQVRRLS